MIRMFTYCKSLLSINAEFAPKNVENMYDMFAYCYKVVIINLPNFRKTKATNIQGMFFKNYKLKYIDLSNFEVSSSINNIQHTFSQCNSTVFIKLDLLKININTNIGYFLNSPYPNITLCIRDENTIIY